MNGQDPEEFIQEEGEMEVTKEMQSDDGQGQGPNEPIFNEGDTVEINIPACRPEFWYWAKIYIIIYS